MKRALTLGLCLLFVAGTLPAPAAATENPEDVVYCTCHASAGNTAHIAFDAVPDTALWTDARQYARVAIQKCDLTNRDVTELAGEIRAHVIGSPIPGATGPTIDMGNHNDPQIDEYGYLM